MKSNCEAIRSNVLPGDILLFRRADSPLITVVDGVTKTNWEGAVFSIGNGLVLKRPVSRMVTFDLEFFLKDEHFKVGLFRTMPEFSEMEIEELMTESKRILDLYYRDLNLLVTPISLMASAYERMGLKFCELPPWKMEPTDFDESPITVRIA